MIDLAAGDIADMLEEEWLVDETDVKDVVLEGIVGIQGERIVSSISLDMAQFLIDCYMAL